MKKSYTNRYHETNLRTIQRIENNENTPRGKSLNLICEVLNLGIEDLSEHEKVNRKTTFVTTIVNGVFLIVLNIVLVVIFGYLTIDSDASLQSKFGFGLTIYTIIISANIDFPYFFMTGLLPSLFIMLATFFYGNELLKLRE